MADGHKSAYGTGMSLLQLRTFVEVYRRRSLSEAARAIGITQPAASQHIARSRRNWAVPCLIAIRGVFDQQ